MVKGGLGFLEVEAGGSAAVGVATSGCCHSGWSGGDIGLVGRKKVEGMEHVVNWWSECFLLLEE